MRADLEALGHGREIEFRRHRAAIPFHEWCADLKNLFTVEADDLRLLCGIIAVGHVVFFARPDVHLAQQRALGHDGQRAVNGGARDRVVDGAGMVEQLLRGEVVLLGESRVEDGQPLVGHAQAAFGEVNFELFAGRVNAHTINVGRAVPPVN
jgi:hypothetical protein